MSDGMCSVDTCSGAKVAKGLCGKHYQRMRNGKSLDRVLCKDAACAISGCRGQYFARGWCARHYQRWSRTGNPEGTRRPFLDSRSERITYLLDQHADKSAGPDACWPWTGDITTWGYGGFHAKGADSRLAHRVAYTAWVGDIPDGHDLDHLCHNPSVCVNGPACPHRRCVNPAHLEPVTSGENTRRGGSKPGVNFRKTHCKRGHPLPPAEERGRRRCWECHRSYRGTASARLA